MNRKKIVRVAAIALAVIMSLPSVSFALGANESNQTLSNTNTALQTKYESPSINELTGHGEEPEELSVSAAATYQEKAWYEYVTYSEHAVCSYRLDDDTRILFYDPYTYTDSMVMDVQFDATTTEFDTMSSYSVSHTNSKTIDACVSSTQMSTDATQTSGRDEMHTEVKNGGFTKTTYNHSIENSTSGIKTEVTDKGYKEYRYSTSSDTDGSSTSGGGGTKNVGQTLASTIAGGLSGFATGGVLGGVIGAGSSLLGGIEVSANHSTSHSHTESNNAAIVLDKETKTTNYSDDYKTSTDYVGDDTVEYNTNSTTEGWTELSARVTKTIGSSITTSNSWSETESTTVTKTYAATHFAADGITPLPWAIVHYSVQMPMKCSLQVKYSGEWITMSTVYCLLTTVQGTCRAWMQNGQVYYEDWGSGEPVVATDFWSQFTTKERLIQAYSDKLYPIGGDE